MFGHTIPFVIDLLLYAKILNVIIWSRNQIVRFPGILFNFLLFSNLVRSDIIFLLLGLRIRRVRLSASIGTAVRLLISDGRLLISIDMFRIPLLTSGISLCVLI